MENFTPSNQLEELLIKAATDPAARPEFLRVLMESDIFVLPKGDVKIENGVAAAGQDLQLLSYTKNDTLFTAFFTSPQRIADAIKEEVKYLGVPAKDFFAITAGNFLIMNAGSVYGKEFFPEEIADIRQGNFNVSEQVIPKKTSIMVGQPAEPPKLLLEELKRIYRKVPAVKAAYMVQYFNPDKEEDGNVLLIGLDLADEAMLASVSEETGKIISSDQKFHPDHKFVDVASVSGEQGNWNFVKKGVKPFYKKSLFGF